MSKNSIQVGIKVRPLLRKGKENGCFWRVVDNTIQLIDQPAEPYHFDHIFDQDVSNQVVFNTMAKQIVHSALQGFNGTIFAYGQTSSGKTYTMMGDNDNPGVMMLTASEIFKEIEKTTDRQFLIRVGYIEIYNEKIYDLLNKKNSDLKLFETAGTVTVNCDEIIITSEGDLLRYLTLGNKERTVGETNMNERSSRSHAIFRIIIESRKINQADGDVVIQSVLNLVDLAGSERADQTGARGTRLKEGGHINKSLLFLSNLIKRLSENEELDKFVSYRDCKLTRILQASLGGNALTSIICTIKPNTIEETQSTLSFALRAKCIKNKPHVNEIVSEATMMKRLEHRIAQLEIELKAERANKGSQTKVEFLAERIKNEGLKILSSKQKRRRTWCPSSSKEDVLNTSLTHASTGIPISTNSLLYQFPPSNAMSNIMLHSVRRENHENNGPSPIPEVDVEEEEFSPGELCHFQRSPVKITEGSNEQLRFLSLTPRGCKTQDIEALKQSLNELQEFTNLEKNLNVDHDVYQALKENLELVCERNKELEKEHCEHLMLCNELQITKKHLTETQSRCEELSQQLNNLKEAENQQISNYENELRELKKTISQLELENREAVGLEIEFQQHRKKSKSREDELLGFLVEKDKEIQKLSNSLQSVTESARLTNSRENLLCGSMMIGTTTTTTTTSTNTITTELNSLNNGNCSDIVVCANCEDFQRLQEEHRKLSTDFTKLTTEYEKLQLSYTQVTADTAAAHTQLKDLYELRENDQKECDILRAEIQILREKLESLQKEYEETKNDCNRKAKDCDELNRELAEARQAMSDLEMRYEKISNNWSEQEKTLTDIQEKYQVVQEKYSKLQCEYEVLKSQQQTQQSLEDCERLKQENESLQCEIQELKQNVEAAQKQLVENHITLTTDAGDLRQQNEDFKKQLAEFQQQLEDLQKENNDLSNEVIENVQENDNLKEQCKKLQEEIEKQKIIEKDLSDKSSSCNETLKAELTALKGELSALEKEKQNLLTSYVDTITDLREEIYKLNDQLLNKSMCIEKYETEMESLHKEKHEMSMLCETLQVKINEYSINVSNMTINQTENDETLCQQSLSEELAAAVEAANELNGREQNETPKSKLKIYFNQERLEEYKQKCEALETECQVAKQKIIDLENAFASKEKEYQTECNRLNLEMLEKLECNENRYRENFQKYKKEWEENLMEMEEKQKAAIEELQKKLQEQTENFNVRQTELENIKKELASKEEQLKKMKNDLTARLQCLENEEKELKDAENQLAKDKNLLIIEKALHLDQEQNLNARKLELELEQNKLTEERKQIDEEHKNLFDERYKFNAQQKLFQQEQKLCQQEKEQIEKTQQDFIAEKADLEIRLALLQAEKQQLEQKIQDLLAEQQEIESRQTKLDSTKKKMKDEILKLILSNNKLHKEIDEMRTANKDESFSDEQNIQALAAIQEKIKNFEALTMETDELKKHIQTLTNKIEQLEGDKSHLQKSLIIEIEEKNHLKTLNEELDDKMKDLDAELGVMKNELSAKNEQLVEQSKKFTDARQEFAIEVERMQQLLEETKQAHNSTQDKHDDLQRKISTLTEELQQATEKSDKLEMDLRNSKEVTANAIKTHLLEMETLQAKLDNATKDQEKLVQKLKDECHTKAIELTTMTTEYTTLQRQTKEIQNQLTEIKLKYDSLLKDQAEMERNNRQLQQQTTKIVQKCANCEIQNNELRKFKAEQILQQIRVEQADKDVAEQKRLLKQQQEENFTIKQELNTKIGNLKKNIDMLEGTIECLIQDKKNFEEKLDQKDELLKKYENELCMWQQKSGKSESQNSSLEMNNSLISPNKRRSGERALGEHLNLKTTAKEDKFRAIQQKMSQEDIAGRKNRRLSIHDERRRQSFWGQTADVGCMTDPTVAGCNCSELDKKLKECQRDLFIRESQLTVIDLQLKNHPLKTEVSIMQKRLQDEQEKHKAELKMLKQVILQQKEEIGKARSAANTAAATAAAATAAAARTAAALSAQSPPTSRDNATPIIVANNETQTDNDLSVCIQKLQSKYDDVVKICRFRLGIIHDLEAKVKELETTNIPEEMKSLKAQIVNLNSQLKIMQPKYNEAKRVLYLRRQEIYKLRGILESAGIPAPTTTLQPEVEDNTAATATATTTTIITINGDSSNMVSK